MNDLIFAFRRLLKNPGFTAVAVLTLALGIGATTAVFSVVHQLLFRPLPYPEAGELVRVYRTSPQSQGWPHSAASFIDQSGLTNVFEGIAVHSGWSYNLSVAGQPTIQVFANLVSGDFLPMLGVAPELGRIFTRDDDLPGRNDVVVLSHQFWSEQFQRDPSLIGQTFQLDGMTAMVIGVMPAGFDEKLLWGEVDLWKPIGFTAEQRAQRGNNWLSEFARLKPGVSLEQAQAELNRLAMQMAVDHPQFYTNIGLRVAPLLHSEGDAAARYQWKLGFGLAMFVMIIACVNVANLQLVRAITRSRELALRAALGACRTKLIRQPLMESLLLALCGGFAGLVIASAMIWLLNRHMIAHDESLRIALNLPVTLFAIGTSLVTYLGFGLVPAFFVSKTEAIAVLKADTRNASSSGIVGRIRRGLVVGQFALALVLLSGAGVVIRGMQQFLKLDPGWRMDGLVVAHMSFSERPQDGAHTNGLSFAELENRLQDIPGVERAGLSTMFPVWGFASTDFAPEDRPAPKRGSEELSYQEFVSPGFFETLGIPLLRGRQFTEFDTSERPAVVVINRALAEHLWPGEDPIGKRIGYHDDTSPQWWEIVGVVGEIRFPGNVESPDTRWQLYRPLAQNPQRAITITLRSELAPATLIPTLNKVVQETHPGTAPYDITSGQQQADRILARSSLLGPVLGVFALLGLLLAAVGVYGVVSFSVAQRTREIGIRMALGAWRSEVLRMVLKQNLTLCVIGALVGILCSLAALPWAHQSMPETSQLEPATFVTAVMVLIASGLLACWLPARRAAKVDPMEALRNE